MREHEPGGAYRSLATAPIDRLMNHCHVVNIRGDAYRMREPADLGLALRPSPDPQYCRDRFPS
jgi:hypothetical protein